MLNSRLKIYRQLLHLLNAPRGEGVKKFTANFLTLLIVIVYS
nr:MAG TPA: hypothetical protein [Caudoviricetes sp.]